MVRPLDQVTFPTFRKLTVSSINLHNIFISKLLGDIDLKSQWTPLHIASRKGHLPIVQYLIENGANIEAKGFQKQTPLHIACAKGHLPIVQYLIKKEILIKQKIKILSISSSYFFLILLYP